MIKYKTMKEKLKKYQCGQCGNDKYELYRQENNRIDLFCECTECKSISIVSFTFPKLEISWGEGARGIMYTDD